MRNVRLSLGAGYDRVLCLFDEEDRVEEMRRALERELDPETLKRVTLAPAATFRDHL